jgi:hypothetical protein
MEKRNLYSEVGGGFRAAWFANPESHSLNGTAVLSFRLAACQLLDLLFLRSAGLGLLALWGGFLTGGALQLLAFRFVFNLGGICHL